MSTLQIINSIPKVDGSNFVEWTRPFYNILKIFWSFPSKIVCVDSKT